MTSRRRRPQSHAPQYAESSSDDEDEQLRPVKRRKARPQAGSGDRSEIDAPPQLEPVDNDIYDAVMDPETALADYANEWLARYYREPAAALCDLINFIFKVSNRRDRRGMVMVWSWYGMVMVWYGHGMVLMWSLCAPTTQ